MDLSNPLPIIKALVPKLPLVGKTTLYHALGLSETSKHWDLRTALIVTIVRSFVLRPGPMPVAKNQHLSLKDPGIKGKLWVAKVTLPRPPEDDIRAALFGAIESLKEEGQGELVYTKPSLQDVTAEWTGYRADATKSTPELDVQKYAEMMKEVSAPATILYFHGGAYYLMDPCTHRPVAAKLAKLTKGRVLSVRYRLAPQNPFPAALLDALVSYLSLLYPPAGSLHQPVAANHVVFSGDSAGGNLCTALLLLLLTLRRQNRQILWNGHAREIPLPGGVALNSPWMDITFSSPSTLAHACYDYLPSRSSHPHGLEWATDHLWPTTPARTHLFADDDLLLHPLVSPLAASSSVWTGSCPVYFCIGWELLSDEGRAVAGRMASAGTTVVFEEFEAMPHCFALVLRGSKASRRCFAGWTGFVTAVTGEEGVESRAVVVKARTLGERTVEVQGLSRWSWEETGGWMRERVGVMRAARERGRL